MENGSSASSGLKLATNGFTKAETKLLGQVL
jgi:hypothetical protein